MYVVVRKSKFFKNLMISHKADKKSRSYITYFTLYIQVVHVSLTLGKMLLKWTDVIMCTLQGYQNPPLLSPRFLSHHNHYLRTTCLLLLFVWNIKMPLSGYVERINCAYKICTCITYKFISLKKIAWGLHYSGMWKESYQQSFNDM